MKNLQSLAKGAVTAGLLIFSAGARAATINVPGDQPTIQAAVNVAGTGDTINIAAGVYTEANITVATTLTIQGQGPDATFVQAAAAENTATQRVFTLSGTGITLRAMTIRYGVVGAGGMGGGVLSAGADNTLDQVMVTANRAARFGGGISTNGLLTITNSTIANNLCGMAGTAGQGGGLYSDGAGVKVVGSTISGNSALDPVTGMNGRGGGVASRNGLASFLNCTIANNSADGFGGGIYGGWPNSPTDHLWIEFSTVAGNSARSGGGIYSMAASPNGPRLRNSIVANNTATGLTGPDLAQAFQSGGYNLIGTNTGFTFDVLGTGPDGQANTAIGNQLGVAAGLGAFADIGGPTRVFPLQSGSRALATANCAAGGNLIQVGLDANRNGALDTAEIASSTYTCNGAAGAAGASGQKSLVTQTAEPAAANCPAGGVKISSGVDTDGDGALQPGEVTGTSYVCHGLDGASGKGALVTQTTEPAGASCPSGGVKIQAGPDSNGDGVLDGNEVANTTYVCNGVNGTNGQTGLTALAAEPPGGNCAAGGTKVTSGLDADTDGALEAGEVTSTSYVCNAASGSNGTNGANALVNVTPEPAGSNCVVGGQRIDTGPDKNGDGVLDAEELTSSAFVCSPPPTARGCAVAGPQERASLIPLAVAALVLLGLCRRRPETTGSPRPRASPSRPSS